LNVMVEVELFRGIFSEILQIALGALTTSLPITKVLTTILATLE
jgi:hypothetical protein